MRDKRTPKDVCWEATKYGDLYEIVHPNVDLDHFVFVSSQEQNAGKVYYGQCENGEWKRILEDVIMMKRKNVKI